MSPKLVVLVPDASCVSVVCQVAQARYWGAGAVVRVLPYDSVETSLSEVRRLYAGGTFAVVARDTAQAFAALEAGADEALAFTTSLDEAGILELLDRAQARARVRIGNERRLESSVQLEKLTALGTLVAGVAHEVNNPVTAVLLSLEVLRKQVDPLSAGMDALESLVRRGTGASQEELETMLRRFRRGPRGQDATQLISEMSAACESIADIVRDLSIYARSSEHEASELVQLPDLIDKVVRLAGRNLSRRAVIERDYDPSVPPVFIPRTRLTQVLTNLLVNAEHAIAEVERSMHRVRITLRADDETVVISVTDTGSGISPDVIERIFDPFFTTKRNNSGTGLGLSISRSIMQDLGGDLIVDSVHGDGATFVAWLPRREHFVDKGEVRDSRPSRRRRVMIVEPDARVLGALARYLRDKHELLLAADGQEAIELFASGSVPDVIVTNADAQDERNRPLLTWLEEQRPDLLPRTIVTLERLEPDRASDYPTLIKPIKPLALLEQIEAAVASAEPAASALNARFVESN